MPLPAKRNRVGFVNEATGTPGDDVPKIGIQHLVVVGDTIVVRHWREYWLFQNTALLAFDRNEA